MKFNRACLKAIRESNIKVSVTVGDVPIPNVKWKLDDSLYGEDSRRMSIRAISDVKCSGYLSVRVNGRGITFRGFPFFDVAPGDIITIH